MAFLESLVTQIGSLMLVFSVFQSFIPHQILETLNLYLRKFNFFFNPVVQITFDEFTPENYGQSKAYAAIQAYLGANFSGHASRLKAAAIGEGRGVALSMGDYEQVSDVYKGVKVSWTKDLDVRQDQETGFRKSVDEKRAYTLSFHRKDQDVVVGSYVGYVLAEGKAIGKRGRKQNLYTNVNGDEYWQSEDMKMWRSVRFEHPATFDTLAMEPKKKKEIMDDLIEFTKARDYYKKIGKPWKRGYLLYGPPGTGKSTMIAAIANFLHYDVYDLELTAVRDNTTLRKLLIEVSKRAIIVIEDIDCSLKITGVRKGNHTTDTTTGDDDDKDGPSTSEDAEKKAAAAAAEEYRHREESRVTLSGLLNFMDGLWSASGGERIFIFTTNHIDKIDEALIRRGRMDKHIEMSYCSFDAFKVLAKNYLDLDFHEEFEAIGRLLSEKEIRTADVAESLMPKSPEMGADECLENLKKLLNEAKEEVGDGEREERESGEGQGETVKKPIRQILVGK